MREAVARLDNEDRRHGIGVIVGVGQGHVSWPAPRSDMNSYGTFDRAAGTPSQVYRGLPCLPGSSCAELETLRQAGRAAAVNGTALGRRLGDFALACHYRVVINQPAQSVLGPARGEAGRAFPRAGGITAHDAASWAFRKPCSSTDRRRTPFDCNPEKAAEEARLHPRAGRKTGDDMMDEARAWRGCQANRSPRKAPWDQSKGFKDSRWRPD